MLLPPESTTLARLDVLVMSSRDVTQEGLEAAAEQLKEMAGNGETRVQIPGLTSDRLLAKDARLKSFCASGGKWHLCECDVQSVVQRQLEPRDAFRRGSLLPVRPVNSLKRGDVMSASRSSGFTFRREDVVAGGDVVAAEAQDLQLHRAERSSEKYLLRRIELPVGLFVQLALLHRGSLETLDLHGLSMKEARVARRLKLLSGFKRCACDLGLGM